MKRTFVTSSLLLTLAVMALATAASGTFTDQTVPSTQAPQLQQRPPHQVGGSLLPPERPHVEHGPGHHRHHRTTEEPSDGDDGHALRLLAKAATGLAACWNATSPEPPTHLTFDPLARCCTFKYLFPLPRAVNAQLALMVCARVRLGCVGDLWSMACPACEPRTSHAKVDWYPHSHHRDGIVQADLDFHLAGAQRPGRCHGRIEVAFTGDQKSIVTLLAPIRCSV
jgi:hypothetical protein